jgi:hypothetical protein
MERAPMTVVETERFLKDVQKKLVPILAEGAPDRNRRRE